MSADSTRDARQATIFAWAKEAFGEKQATSLPQRGLRLLEEAAEAFQACGGTVAQAHYLVDYVFGRPVGEIHQELGGVGVTLCALAAAAGLSAEAEEIREVARVLAKPIAQFARRNQEKNDAGLVAPGIGVGPSPPIVVTAESFSPGDDNRCAICGWLLVPHTAVGCVRGNCSMRPLPARHYDHERAVCEYAPGSFGPAEGFSDA